MTDFNHTGLYPTFRESWNGWSRIFRCIYANAVDDYIYSDASAFRIAVDAASWARVDIVLTGNACMADSGGRAGVCDCIWPGDVQDVIGVLPRRCAAGQAAFVPLGRFVCDGR